MEEDVLVVQTYLVDVEVPFLCGKRTLEMWNFKIDGRSKISEIQSKDSLRKKIKMIDTQGRYYGIIWETWKESSIIFLEDEETYVLTRRQEGS